MDWPVVLNVIVSGLALGSIYAMLAVGFSLLWQTSRTVNFAQGDFAVAPGYGLILFASVLALPLGLAAVLTIFSAAVILGYLFRKILISRLINFGVGTTIVATIAFSIALQNAFLVFWTPRALKPPSLIDNTLLQLGSVQLSARDIANFLVAAAMVAGLQVFLRRTKTGKALQAVAQNSQAARILGIDDTRMITIAFVINAVLAAVAGMLIGPIFLVKYNLGIVLGLAAFYSAIIGGFNRVRGAIVGGLLVGVLETLSAAFISTQYKIAIVLALLIVVVLVKPEGLVGVREVDEHA